ncbi:MAG: hypothetical protein A3F70_01945 [Acidobacteria bacterium RIFCSPLOWO2_12_FULL_67_14]|nr:MAG: hypothetical protein A3F70_01945 [Acidobacteria bacterium RIFCSPLOWO2_12_FULL_67_14]
MRSAIVIAMLMAASAAVAQTPPAAPAPKPTQTPAPAPAAPRRPVARATARGGLVITVTDPQGTRLMGVHVEVVGESDRSGDTGANGQMSFTGMQAGTYRLRLGGPSVITFEKEVALRAGQTADVDVTLYPAPPPPPPPPPAEPPPAPAPAAPVVGPAGDPLTLSVINLVEKELIPNNQPRRETLVACSGNTRTMVIQLNQDQPERLYDTAEATYYVIAGEGAVRMDGREMALAPGTFVSVPRATAHGVIRRGRRPLILLATLGGVPCEEAR